MSLKDSMQRCSLFNEDCLTGMHKIPDQSVQLILTDPPYNTTTCKWDKALPLDELWAQFRRVLKPNGTVAIFCQQPFTTDLVASNREWFKYMWYWRKSRPSGYTNAKLKPLKDIEEIAVFSPASTANGAKVNMLYNPQGLIRVDKEWKRPRKYGDGTGVNATRPSHTLERTIEYTNYPRQVLDYPNHNGKLLHPTQKPVELCEYLIRTYTNEDDMVLDACAGSGTTCVAAINTQRRCVAFEKDVEFFAVAQRRIEECYNIGEQSNE